MRNEVLDSFAINFINNHFDEIDLKKVEWNVKTKKQAIKDIKEKDYMAGWVITEVMQWGTPIDYTKGIKVEMDEENPYFVVKIDDRYFALDYTKPHCFNEVFPRKVVVEKLVFDDLN
jgi:hypothetical protein